MSGLIEIRQKARRDLHDQAKVPAVYLAYEGATPTPINPRIHDKIQVTGLGQNVLPGLAEYLDDQPRVVFDLVEIPNPEPKAFVFLNGDEGYQVTVSEPPRGEFQMFKAIRMSTLEVAEHWDDAWEDLL